MMKFDHLVIPVADMPRSRGWYLATLGLTVEFEVRARQAVALRDSDGFTIFLEQAAAPVQPGGCALYFQVTDVDATCAEWSARGVEFARARGRPTGATAPSSGIRTAYLVPL